MFVKWNEGTRSLLPVMPLWSNEEWRARIGSSWCALGKPIEPSKFSHGRRRSQTHHLFAARLLQGVFIVMMLTSVAIILETRNWVHRERVGSSNSFSVPPVWTFSLWPFLNQNNVIKHQIQLWPDFDWQFSLLITLWPLQTRLQFPVHRPLLTEGAARFLYYCTHMCIITENSALVGQTEVFLY